MGYLILNTLFNMGIFAAFLACLLVWVAYRTDRVWLRKWWKALAGMFATGVLLSVGSYATLYYYIVQGFEAIAL